MLGIRYDLRLPHADAAERKHFLDVAIEQIRWAERLDFSVVTLSEHHGSPDGYLPSPIVFGAAVAASTATIRINIAALIVALHDPLRLAEDLAVLDLISGGRLIVTVGAGYVPEEFAMFGRNLRQRGKAVEEAISTFRAAWTGEPFDHRGRRVRLTPRPFQAHVPILMGGQSEAAARRAAEMADGYAPVLPSYYEDYRVAVVELGRPDPGPLRPMGPRFLYVADDPERAWQTIAPYLLHESNAYAAWAERARLDTGYYRAVDVSDLKHSGHYAVVDPSECLELCRSLGPSGSLTFHPLAGGMDPALSWASLELFESKVLPSLVKP